MKGKKEAFISTVTEGGAIPIPPDVKTRLEITDGDNVQSLHRETEPRQGIHAWILTPGRTDPDILHFSSATKVPIKPQLTINGKKGKEKIRLRLHL